jgi:hypothetical protein
MGERRLAQAGRTIQQHMIDRFIPPLRRLNQYRQVRAQVVLTDQIMQALRTQGLIQYGFLLLKSWGDYAVIHSGAYYT